MGRKFLYILATVSVCLSSCGQFRWDRHETAPEPTTLQEGWSSGGGAIVADQLNPWYLAVNTPVVKYCINIDESAFGIDQAHAKDSIEKAVNYWQRRFEEAKQNYFVPKVTSSYYPELSKALEIPRFSYTSCDDGDILLTFQLGTLSKDQIDSIGDPNSFIALARRTSYDDENLRGHGFIYVSPGSGPLAPHNPKIKTDRWTKEGILKLVVAHELGHTLGFGHSFPSNLMKELMPEDYSEIDASPIPSMPELDHFYEKFEPAIFRFVHGDKSACINGMDNDTSIKSFHRFLGIETDCFMMHLTDKGFDIYGYNFNEGDPTDDQRGSAVYLDASPEFPKIIAYEPGLSIYLTDRQTVFPISKTLATLPDRFQIGTFLKSTEKEVAYKSKDGKATKTFTVILSNNYAIMSGIQDGAQKTFRFDGW